MTSKLPAKIKIAIVDDHQMFRKGVIALIGTFSDEYVVLFEASNGLDFQQKINLGYLPEIVLLDINMPDMNGYDTVAWLNKYFPDIKILIISMIEKEESISRMVKMGVKGYLTKKDSTSELRSALDAILKKGYYYTDYITGKLIHKLQSDNNTQRKELNNQEKRFLQFACSELTYQQIADKMFLSVKTIDDYRSALFNKFEVTSRVGLVLYAVRNEMFTP